MRIEVLRNFAAIVSEGSISKAAQKLFISQQGLNQSVAALEKELDCTLLERTQQGVSPTHSGRAFLGHVLNILSEYDRMLETMSSAEQDVAFLQKQKVKITVSPVCLIDIIAPLIERGVMKNVTLREATAEQAFKHMDEPNWLFFIDLFSSLYPSELLEKEYYVIPMLDTKIGILSRKNCFPSLPRVVPLEIVSKLPLGIFDNETTQAMYGEIFKDHPLENVLISTSNKTALHEGMHMGRYAILADSYAYLQTPDEMKKGSQGVVFSELAGNFVSTFAFVGKKSAPMSEIDQRYVNSLLRYLSSTF
jgi:molybdenum-dependent DNA-binding transcriptional regulator ModE